jgi:hypothetical protein
MSDLFPSHTDWERTMCTLTHGIDWNQGGLKIHLNIANEGILLLVLETRGFRKSWAKQNQSRNLLSTIRSSVFYFASESASQVTWDGFASVLPYSVRSSLIRQSSLIALKLQGSFGAQAFTSDNSNSIPHQICLFNNPYSLNHPHRYVPCLH